MKKIYYTIIFVLAYATAAQAGILDLQFTYPVYTPGEAGQNGTYCVTVQMRSQDVDVNIGSGTIFFSYNPAAIAQPQVTPINFSETNLCLFNNTAGAYKNSFNFLELNDKGEGNYALLLNSANSSCPTITNEWVDVAQYCFQVVNPNEAVNLEFTSKYTAFNTQTDTGAMHELGNLNNLTNDMATSITTPSSIIKPYTLAIMPSIISQSANIYLHLNKADKVNIRIFDMAGKILYQTTKQYSQGDINEEISLANFANGTYIVEVSGKHFTSSKKINVIN